MYVRTLRFRVIIIVGLAFKGTESRSIFRSIVLSRSLSVLIKERAYLKKDAL